MRTIKSRKEIRAFLGEQTRFDTWDQGKDSDEEYDYMEQGGQTRDGCKFTVYYAIPKDEEEPEDNQSDDYYASIAYKIVVEEYPGESDDEDD